MPNLKISVDLDGVVCSFVKATIPIVNALYPHKLPNNYQPTDWNFSDALTKSELDDVFAAIKNTTNFWLSVPEYTGNVTALTDFLETNPSLDVYYVTSRLETVGQSVLVQTSEWLWDRDLWPREGHATIVPVPSSKKKAAVIEALKIPYSIDDYIPTVESCNNILGHRAFLLDRPWNQEYTGVNRVHLLDDYLKQVKEVPPLVGKT